MDNKLAIDILRHFDMQTMQVLDAYISDRKSFLHKQMENVTEADNWRKHQGACLELELLRKMRDIATAIKDKGNG